MAGDWIKMRIDLLSHPKIVRILSATKSDKFRVVGGLHAVWSIFDTHSEDGVLDGYSAYALDHVIGWDGFSAALLSVGWLEEFDGTLVMPEFDEHNGKSGKRRAEDQKRKRDARKDPENVRILSASEQDKNGTREREEKEKIKAKQDQKTTAAPRRDWLTELIEHGVSEKHARDWLEVRRGKKAKMTDTVIDGIKREARIANVSFGEAIRISAESGWQGFKADWVNKPAANGGSQFMTKQERIEAANQRVLEEMNAAADAMLAQQANHQPALDDQGFVIEGDFFREN